MESINIGNAKDNGDGGVIGKSQKKGVWMHERNVNETDIYCHREDNVFFMRL